MSIGRSRLRSRTSSISSPATDQQLSMVPRSPCGVQPNSEHIAGYSAAARLATLLVHGCFLRRRRHRVRIRWERLCAATHREGVSSRDTRGGTPVPDGRLCHDEFCLLYTSDAADDLLCV